MNHQISGSEHRERTVDTPVDKVREDGPPASIHGSLLEQISLERESATGSLAVGAKEIFFFQI